MPSRRALLAVLSAVAWAAAVVPATAATPAPVIREVVLHGEIDPASQRYLDEQIDAASRRGDAAIVIRMDTPGGLSSSMHEIIKHELASKVPVVVWVAPDGARAASAGLFLAMAADVVAMAPQTNIGSATPINSSGQNIGSDLRRKVINDAVAQIRALAQSHGRNADWAERAVRVAANLPASDAVAQHVAEFEAGTQAELLARLDGFRTKPKGLVVHTRGARVQVVQMSFPLRVLQALIDPNIVFLLFLGGIALIVFEVAHPGLIAPGLVGAAMVLVALFGLSVLPFTWTGVALVGAGIALLVAELHVGHGALAILGLALVIVGGLSLFDTAGTPYQVSTPLVIAIAIALAAFLWLVVSRVLKARHAPLRSGDVVFLGSRGVVREALTPRGLVAVDGALWQAETADGAPLAAGAAVVVNARRGLLLEVAPVPVEAQEASCTPS
jgi:membrane-bound serine protease (ClpP class)